jgi:hypothetical protein
MGEAGARERRVRRMRYAAVSALVILLAAALVVAVGTRRSRAGGLPRPIDGIRCDASEQVLFHVHSHLAVFVEGRALPVPAGIGIAAPRRAERTSAGAFVVDGACFYWLHTHARDGIIHIESPVERAYTLGEFFDIWGQPLGRAEVAGARGSVTAYVDGRPFSGDPRSIALGAHRVIQLDVGQPVPPRGFSFPPGL